MPPCESVVSQQQVSALSLLFLPLEKYPSLLLSQRRPFFWWSTRLQDIKEIGIFLFLFSSHFWALHAEVDNFTTILENMLHKGLRFPELNMPKSQMVEISLKNCEGFQCTIKLVFKTIISNIGTIVK